MAMPWKYQKFLDSDPKRYKYTADGFSVQDAKNEENTLM